VVRAPVSKAPADTVPQSAQREAAYDWTPLRERVAACTRCGLSATRTQTVFGVGNPTAEWLVVGEAPVPRKTDRVNPSSAGPASS